MMKHKKRLICRVLQGPEMALRLVVSIASAYYTMHPPVCLFNHDRKSIQIILPESAIDMITYTTALGFEFLGKPP